MYIMNIAKLLSQTVQHPGIGITYKTSTHVPLVISVSSVPVGHIDYKKAVCKNFYWEIILKNVSFAHFIYLFTR